MSREVLRVAYDVSVLGWAHQNPLGRTGVFRYVEHLAQALMRSGLCDLTFCATESLYLYFDVKDLVARHRDFHSIPMRTPLPGVRATEALQGWIRRINERPLSLPRRIVRRLLAENVHFIARWSTPAADVDGLGADIFHSPYGAFPASRLRRPRHTRRFLTVHDLIPLLYPQHCDAAIARNMRSVYGSLTPADWALADSENTRTDLLNYRPDLDPTRVIATPLAADAALFHRVSDPTALAAVRARYGVPEGPYLLSLNTLEPRKNLDRLVRAFAQLVQQENVPDLHLVLVGARGWKTEGLFEALARSGAARDRVILTGYVADDDLASLYSGALGFVYPSLYEGFGLPPLEAMQCGVPVITSNTSSLPEVVGDAGLLVVPTDEDALAEAMLTVYRDASLRERLAARSLARAAQFSWARCAEQTVAAYRAALAS